MSILSYVSDINGVPVAFVPRSLDGKGDKVIGIKDIMTMIDIDAIDDYEYSNNSVRVVCDSGKEIIINAYYNLDGSIESFLYDVDGETVGGRVVRNFDNINQIVKDINTLTIA